MGRLDSGLLLELKESYGLSELFLESIQDGLFIADSRGRIVLANSALCRLTGFERQALLGADTPYPFWPPELHAELEGLFKPSQKDGIKGEFDTVHLRKDGTTFPVGVFVTGITDSKGRVIAQLVLLWDVAPKGGNDLHQNAAGLTDRERLLVNLQTTLNTIADGIITLNADWCYTYINKKGGEFLGRDPDSLLGKNMWAEFPEAVNQPIYKILHKALETQKKEVLQAYYEPWDKWMENRVYPSPDGITIYFSDITELKRTELQNVHQESILSVINETLTQPLFILSVHDGPKFKFISVSNSLLNILGITEEAVIDKYVSEFIPEPSLSLVLSKYQEAIAQKKTIHWEEKTPYQTGLKTAIVTISPLFNSEGKCTHLVGLIYDITEIKNIEALLVENEKHLDNILNNIGDPIFVKDNQSRILLVNEAFCSIFGLSKNDILGKTLAEDVAPEERESFLSIDRHVLDTGLENINEESLTVRGGETKFISTKKTRFVDDQGNRYLIGIIRDITKRRKAEMELQAAKEYSEGLITSMNEGLVVFNKKTEIIDVNPAFCQISGFSTAELLGQQCPYPFTPPEGFEQSEYRHREISQGNELAGFETVYIRKDGTRFNAGVTVSQIRNAAGEIESYFATVVDTTERKKSEYALKAAKDFTDNLIMSMHEGLMISDPRGKLTFVNDATCKILGYTREELIGMEIPYPYASTESLEAIPAIVNELNAGEAPSFQLEYIRKGGERFPVYFTTGTIRDDNDQVIALFGTMKDISEEVKTQRVLEENARKSTQKKDVILRLASLVSEDFKYSLDQITKLAAETLNVERVGVWQFSPDYSLITCEKLYLRSTGTFEEGRELHKRGNPDYFEALETYQTILIEDALHHKATRLFADNYLMPNNIKSLMDVFINSTNGLFGIICFEHVGQSTRHWSAEDHEFATSLANIVSLMVESRERKIAENKLILSNQELSKANTELEVLRTKLEQENVYLRKEIDLVFNFEHMVYGSEAFSNVLTDVEKVAATNATVLLLGESGTGKELLARAIHNIGLRNSKPLIKVNCAAIPRELIESELFGHKKGAFTGAGSDKIGKFELADGGTLFLDEIGELPLDMQPKLLRFLQEGEIEIIGSPGTKKLDVRVIAATNRNLKKEIQRKRFREDLFFRLNVFPIVVPPLRERREDIPLLIEHFIDNFNKKYNKEIRFVTDASMEKLIAYDWPGNIRELENLIERAVILCEKETLVIPGFESEAQLAKASIGTNNLSMDYIQRNHILSVLEKCKWKISGPGGASEILELKPSTLRDKMAKLGIKKAN